MRASLVAALLTAVAIPITTTTAQSSVSPPSDVTPTITVTARGEAQVRPDRAVVRIAVETRATTAAAAAAANARRQRGILDTLRTLGVARDKIGTVAYTVTPTMHYEPNHSPTVTGYTVTNMISAELSNLDQVGRVLDAVLAKGANRIAGLSFVASTADSARCVALAEAMANAKADAEVIARASGGVLDGLIDASTSSAGWHPMPIVYDRAGFTTASATRATPTTPVEPRTEVVQVTVTTRWRLRPDSR